MTKDRRPVFRSGGSCHAEYVKNVPLCPGEVEHRILVVDPACPDLAVKLLPQKSGKLVARREHRLPVDVLKAVDGKKT